VNSYNCQSAPPVKDMHGESWLAASAEGEKEKIVRSGTNFIKLFMSVIYGFS